MPKPTHLSTSWYYHLDCRPVRFLFFVRYNISYIPKARASTASIERITVRGIDAKNKILSEQAPQGVANGQLLVAGEGDCSLNRAWTYEPECPHMWAQRPWQCRTYTGGKRLGPGASSLTLPHSSTFFTGVQESKFKYLHWHKGLFVKVGR